jgi:uncharacterized protein YjiS (DUF1127 family)
LSPIYVDVANRRQGREWISGIARIVNGVCATTTRWRDRVRYRRALATMNERELTDIGVCWSEVAEDVSKPFWRA